MAMKDVQINIQESKNIFLSGYKTISVKRAGVLTCPYPKLGARLEVDSDLEPLFPYINGSVQGAQYFDTPERIQFIFEGVQCTLYKHEIIAAAFHDNDHAMRFGESLLSFLNDLFAKRGSIAPNYRKSKHLSAIDIYKILPRTNCRECGFQSCLAFVGALSTGEVTIDQCPGASRPIEEKAVYPVVDGEGRLTDTIELDLPERQNNAMQSKHTLMLLLTERELQVLKLLAQGHTNPEISEELFISPHTVKTHVVHIYEKLGVNDRAQAAVLASRYNLI